MPKGTRRKSRRGVPGVRPGSNPPMSVHWDHAEYESVIRARAQRRHERKLAAQYEEWGYES